MKPIIPDKLSASFPLSTKIVSCSEGHLILDGDSLNQVIKHAKEVSWSLSNDTPLALLSIMGVPSPEKYLLIKSLLEYYAHGKGRIKEKSGKNVEKVNSVESSTGTKMLDSPGVYLLNKPVYMEMEKQGKLLIWIMFLPGSEDTEDLQLMERFLLLASSRIAEVEFENEEFHGLKQWAELEGLLKTSTSTPQQICLSFIHAVPSTKTSSSSRTSLHRLSTTTLSGQKLHLDLDLNKDEGPTVKDKLYWGINLITMSSSNCQNEAIGRVNTQSLADINRKIPKVSAKAIHEEEGRGLGLNGFLQFMKDCVDSVNDISDMERARPRATSLSRSPRVSLRPKVQRSIGNGLHPNEVKVNGVTSSILRADSEMDMVQGYPDPPVILRRQVPGSSASKGRPVARVLPHRSSIPLPPQPQPLTLMEAKSLEQINYATFGQNTIPSPEKEIINENADKHSGNISNLSCRVIAVHKKRSTPEPEVDLPNSIPSPYDKNGTLPQADLDPAIFCEMIDAAYGFPFRKIAQEELTISEEDLAKKLLPKVLAFYNDEMSRFLDDDAYSPTVLDSIHLNLKKLIFDDVSKIFKLAESQAENLRLELMTSLDQAYLQSHRYQNTVNLKRKQEIISKCMGEMVSSYKEQIEEVLQRNPNGLRICQLKRENGAILNRVQRKLQSQIRGKVRDNEPMEGYIHALMEEANEYWAGVVERNDRNLRKWNGTHRRGQLPEPDNFEENVDSFEKAKQHLNNKIEEITNQLEEGEQFFAFKSQSEEDQLKMKVKRASSFLQKEDSTLGQIQLQASVLQIWASEYKKCEGMKNTYFNC